MTNVLCNLLNIKYPIIQGGMVWCSGWKLAAAVSNEGGLGVLGSGSMYPEVLDEHLIKLKRNTTKPFAVNLPLLYPQIPDHIELILKHKVPIVITSAGNPALYTEILKKAGCKVLHVVASPKFAQKAINCGVDGIIAEGTEAGGHNGKEELTTLTLIPLIKQMCSIPLVAAGGIGCGKAMYSVMALGADGVQVGSRFAISKESSAHENFKQAVINSKVGDNILTLKELTPVRLLKNKFYQSIENAYAQNASTENLKLLLGKGRAKKGIFEGDLAEGELEIGQIAAGIHDILSVSEIFKSFKTTYQQTAQVMQKMLWDE